jgi:hypothetical protein
MQFSKSTVRGDELRFGRKLALSDSNKRSIIHCQFTFAVIGDLLDGVLVSLRTDGMF